MKMSKLQEEYEKTGYISWINTNAPSGQSYTRAYVEWLEKKIKAQEKNHPTAFADVIPRSEPIRNSGQDCPEVCPKCGEPRMTRHISNNERYCWAGCGWVDKAQ